MAEKGLEKKIMMRKLFSSVEINVCVYVVDNSTEQVIVFLNAMKFHSGSVAFVYCQHVRSLTLRTHSYIAKV